MSSFLQDVNPHTLLKIMKLCAFILGAYLMAPAPSPYTIACWLTATVIFMVWTSWNFTRHPIRESRFDFKYSVLKAIACAAFAFTADQIDWHPDLIALLYAASTGFLGIFVALLPCTLLVMVFRPYNRPKPAMPAPVVVTYPTLLGM